MSANMMPQWKIDYEAERLAMEQALFPDCPTSEMLKAKQELWTKEARFALANKFVEFKKSDPKPYFDWEHIFTLPHLQAPYIKIYVVVGQRNIGKTFSWKKLCEKVVKGGRRFAIGRVSQIELDQLMARESNQWLAQNGWEFRKVSNEIVNKEDEQVVGYAFSLTGSGGKKSIDSPNVDLVVLDEFSTDRVQAKAVNYFVQILTTIQRHNNNLQVVLSANFVNPADRFLSNFGVIPKVSKENLLEANWLFGIVFVFIPNDTYNANKDINNAGYRASLANAKTYKANYGAGYEGNDNFILGENELDDFRPKWEAKLIQSNSKLTPDITYTIGTISDTNKVAIVDDVYPNTVKVCFTEMIHLMNPDYRLVAPRDILFGLLMPYKNNKVWFHDYAVKEIFTKELEMLDLLCRKHFAKTKTLVL